MPKARLKKPLYLTNLRIIEGSFLAALLVTAYIVLYNIDAGASREESIADLSCFSDMSMQTFDGNTFDNTNMKDYKLIVLNTWETTCGVCVGEMPAIEELSRTYEKKGVLIAGMCADTSDPNGSVNEELLNDARTIIGQVGVTYPQLIPSLDIQNSFVKPVCAAYPTTVFLDSEGNVLDIVTGARSGDKWSDIIENELVKAENGGN